MNRLLIGCMLLGIVACTGESRIRAKVAGTPRTFCNPLNLDYRFMKVAGGEGVREAADPVVVFCRGKYFLFASKSSGYWYSADFIDWTHVIIPDTVLPIEDYAPAVFVHKDTLYYVGSTSGKGMVYRSGNPEEGKWEKVKEIWSYWDPAFYVEGDKLYLYYGCSPVAPIHVQVLDLATFDARSEVLDCLNSDCGKHGWERTGEHHELSRRPYIEGAWMTECGRKYYLQYAAPGTEWKSYADGVYVADSPTGPFCYMGNSPVSYKPAGFTGGAGHGCMFQAEGQWWKAATNSISVRHMFERRLSFYPAGFDADGYLYTNTYLGDYPMFRPASVEAGQSAGPGWMLLSYRKPVTVSSALAGFPAENAVDEESRTGWVAAGNTTDEWLQVDLRCLANINAIQVNYDEYGASQRGWNPELYESYIIYASVDGREWVPVVDKRNKRTDTPHDYVEFEQPFRARYVKWVNQGYNVSSHVSLRELRVFGLGDGEKPVPVTGLKVKREETDLCKAFLSWNKSEGADGYVIRYGLADDKLYHSYQVLGDTVLEMGSLNSGVHYHFTVDAYNENGITAGLEIKVE